MTLLLCRQKTLAQTICSLMGLGLFILLDTLVTMMLASRTGAYLALAIVAGLSWFLVAFIFSSMSRHIKLMKAKLETAAYPDHEFRHLAGLGLALVFAIVPGLVTDLIALVLYCIPARLAAGSLIFKHNQGAWEEAAQILSSE